jgi:hypothetical protein
MTQHVKIDLTQPGRAHVIVDGVEICQITAIDVACRPGGMNTVTLTLIPDTVEITGVADVVERHAKLG